MPFLRLLFAGLIALAALAAGLFAALLLFATGLVAFFLRSIQGKARPAPPPRSAPPASHPVGPADDVIDVVATRVPPEPPVR